MYPSLDKHAAVVFDKKALDQVVALLVESGAEFKVVQSSNTDEVWMLREIADEVDYNSSSEDWNDSGCEF